MAEFCLIWPKSDNLLVPSGAARRRRSGPRGWRGAAGLGAGRLRPGAGLLAGVTGSVGQGACRSYPAPTAALGRLPPGPRLRVPPVPSGAARRLRGLAGTQGAASPVPSRRTGAASPVGGGTGRSPPAGPFRWPSGFSGGRATLRPHGGVGRVPGGLLRGRGGLPAFPIRPGRDRRSLSCRCRRAGASQGRFSPGPWGKCRPHPGAYGGSGAAGHGVASCSAVVMRLWSGVAGLAAGVGRPPAFQCRFRRAGRASWGTHSAVAVWALMVASRRFRGAGAGGASWSGPPACERRRRRRGGCFRSRQLMCPANGRRAGRTGPHSARSSRPGPRQRPPPAIPYRRRSSNGRMCRSKCSMGASWSPTFSQSRKCGSIP